MIYGRQDKGRDMRHGYDISSLPVCKITILWMGLLYLLTLHEKRTWADHLDLTDKSSSLRRKVCVCTPSSEPCLSTRDSNIHPSSIPSHPLLFPAPPIRLASSTTNTRREHFSLPLTLQTVIQTPQCVPSPRLWLFRRRPSRFRPRRR